MRAPKWITALKRLVERAHRHQKYGNQPYSVHIMEVVQETERLMIAEGIERGSDYWWKNIGAAMGHDLFEDTGKEEKDLVAIGVPVDTIIAIRFITKEKHETRKEYIFHKVLSNLISTRVKIADSSCNLQHSLASREPRRVTKYTENLQWLVKEWEHVATR